MRYLAEEGTVIHTAEDGNDRKVFASEEWLAAACQGPRAAGISTCGSRNE